MKNELERNFVASVPPPRYNGGVYAGWREPIGWCNNTFGSEGGCWHYCSEGVFVFVREEDCAMFLLRWN